MESENETSYETEAWENHSNHMNELERIQAKLREETEEYYESYKIAAVERFKADTEKLYKEQYAEVEKMIIRVDKRVKEMQETTLELENEQRALDRVLTEQKMIDMERDKAIRKLIIDNDLDAFNKFINRSAGASSSVSTQIMMEDKAPVPVGSLRSYKDVACGFTNFPSSSKQKFSLESCNFPTVQYSMETALSSGNGNLEQGGMQIFTGVMNNQGNRRAGRGRVLDGRVEGPDEANEMVAVDDAPLEQVDNAPEEALADDPGEAVYCGQVEEVSVELAQPANYGRVEAAPGLRQNDEPMEAEMDSDSDEIQIVEENENDGANQDHVEVLDVVQPRPVRRSSQEAKKKISAIMRSKE